MSALILRSVRSVDHVIVQANWMKEKICSVCDVDAEQISVVQPLPSKAAVGQKYVATPDSRRKFIYPAADLSYKNHGVLFAAAELVEKVRPDIEIACTLSEREAQRLGFFRISANVNLMGRLFFEEVQLQYAERVLVFPSLLETVGFPLIEGMSAGTFVLAPALPYAMEVLKEYPNALFFDPGNPEELANLILAVAKGAIVHATEPFVNGTGRGSDPWADLIEEVVQHGG